MELSQKHISELVKEQGRDAILKRVEKIMSYFSSDIRSANKHSSNDELMLKSYNLIIKNQNGDNVEISYTYYDIVADDIFCASWNIPISVLNSDEKMNAYIKRTRNYETV